MLAIKESEDKYLYVKLSGVRDPEVQRVIRSASVGEQVIVTRDLFNYVNPYAMAVYIKDQFAGYIEKKYERKMAGQFDNGGIISSQIYEIKGTTRGGTRGVILKIRIEGGKEQ